ncbi:uncharacterized protein [Cicer arietinum]|uniref:uncharacterized protein isoform X2 n=1 Tax=Cicer arietinum TaxID=3827 RepID=UPI00032AD153
MSVSTQYQHMWLHSINFYFVQLLPMPSLVSIKEDGDDVSKKLRNTPSTHGSRWKSMLNSVAKHVSQAAIWDTLVLPNSESISIPWMLAEKDDWVPRQVAPFIWINPELVMKLQV